MTGFGWIRYLTMAKDTVTSVSQDKDNRLTFLDIPLWLVTFGVWFLNAVDAVLSFFGYKMCKITIDNVLQGLEPEAKAQALHPDIQQPLSLILHGLQLDTEMSVMPRLFQARQIRQVLRRRARMERCLQEHPEVFDTPIKRPLFIIGFPRSGTTMLHHLLAQDPQFEAPMMWHLIYPHRPGRPDNWRQDHRYKRFKRVLEVWRATDNIKIDPVHVIDAANPEECFFILQDFLYQVHYFIRIRSLAGFAEWFYGVGREEMKNIYRYYKRVLQVMGHKRMEGRQFVLKSHVHLMNLAALMDVYPDAKLVFTYRKMTELLPSFCSLMVQTTYDWGELEPDFGERCVRLMSELANRAVTFMKSYDNVPETDRPFCNIDYADLVKDPVGTMKQLYQQFGYTMTSETEQRMHDWVKNNPQHKHGRHSYSMEKYGIKEQDILDNFGAYLDYFKDKSTNLI